MKNIQSQKGFTLAEMLVVVFIVALLSAVAVIGLGGVRSQGRDTKRIADLRQVQNGLELYYSRNGVYPDLDVTTAAGWDTLETTLGLALPRDPLPAQTYYYTASPTNQGYALSAQLENEMSPSLQAASVDAVSFGAPAGFPDCGSTSNTVYCVEF